MFFMFSLCSLAPCLATDSVAADLVDFRTTGISYPVYAGAYRAECAAEQLTIGADGLTLRTDPAKEKQPAHWIIL